jgi:hypothetical protein
MYSPYHYQSRSDAALDLAHGTQNKELRASYVKLSVYWNGLAIESARGLSGRESTRRSGRHNLGDGVRTPDRTALARLARALAK